MACHNATMTALLDSSHLFQTDGFNSNLTDGYGFCTLSENYYGTLTCILFLTAI
jgi:hypothetical protein